MCGDLKPGETAAQFVLHFTTNQSHLRLPINTRLEHVVELRLTDYSIVAPNGGAAVPNLWRFQIVGLQEFETNSSGGQGFAICIQDKDLTFVHYDNPRVISKSNAGYLNTLDCVLTTYLGVPASFTEATFFITVVMRDTKYRPQQYITDDKQTPNFPSLQFDTRATI